MKVRIYINVFVEQLGECEEELLRFEIVKLKANALRILKEQCDPDNYSVTLKIEETI